MIETSLRLRSSMSAAGIRMRLASASSISSASGVSLLMIPVRTRPSLTATTIGSNPIEIFAEGYRTAAISSSRGYLAPTLDSSGPTAPPCPPTAWHLMQASPLRSENRARPFSGLPPPLLAKARNASGSNPPAAGPFRKAYSAAVVTATANCQSPP